MASTQAKNRLGEAEKEKKKIIVPINFYPSRNRELKKNSKKIQKIKKLHCGFVSSQNGLGETEKEEKKILVLTSSYLTQTIEFQTKKKAKKFKKL